MHMPQLGLLMSSGRLLAQCIENKSKLCKNKPRINTLLNFMQVHYKALPRSTYPISGLSCLLNLLQARCHLASQRAAWSLHYKHRQSVTGYVTSAGYHRVSTVLLMDRLLISPADWNTSSR